MKIGEVSYPRGEPKRPELVPSTLFVARCRFFFGRGVVPDGAFHGGFRWKKRRASLYLLYIYIYMCVDDEKGVDHWPPIFHNFFMILLESSELWSKVDIPQHLSVLRAMLIDWLLDRHLLLIGNQGVGKNKLADRFLGLLRLEREYIQLHRDTTVQSLTIQPTLVNGVVIYEDSPLVSAVRHGRVLVIDEADKAPLEVVCILKSLAEDGEFTLADGRTIMKPERVPSQVGIRSRRLKDVERSILSRMKHFCVGYG